MRLAGFGVLECPPEIGAGLRAIDPLAELVHLGGAEWLLGVRKPNPRASEQIERQLKTIATTKNEVADVADRARVDLEMAKELQLLQLFASGFRPIHIYTIDGDKSLHEIVKDFETRDYNWRVRPEEAFAELRDELSFDVQDRKRTALIFEKVAAEAKDMFRFVVRGARGFLQHAFPSSSS